MKNVVVAAIAMLATTFAFAGDPVSKFAVVGAKQSSVFKVIYEGAAAGNVTLTIFDGSGVIVYNETIKGIEKFIRPVNFEGMEAGEYSIEIADVNGKQSQKVSVGSIVSFESDADFKGVHVSKVSTDNGKYLLSVANNGVEKVTVRILDGESNLIYSETFSVNGDFGKVFNLKQVKGNPTFEVASANSITKIVK